jgi:hypothetical protein
MQERFEIELVVPILPIRGAHLRALAVTNVQTKWLAEPKASDHGPSGRRHGGKGSAVPVSRLWSECRDFGFPTAPRMAAVRPFVEGPEGKHMRERAGYAYQHVLGHWVAVTLTVSAGDQSQDCEGGARL